MFSYFPWHESWFSSSRACYFSSACFGSSYAFGFASNLAICFICVKLSRDLYAAVCVRDLCSLPSMLISWPKVGLWLTYDVLENASKLSVSLKSSPPLSLENKWTEPRWGENSEKLVRVFETLRL